MVATPTFSVTGGSYSTPQLVALTDTTPGSTIYYTVDGSAPTTSSAVYLGVPIYAYTSQTLKAIAAATGLSSSAVGSSSYTIAQQFTRFSLSRNTAAQVTNPAPLDDRPAPFSGVRISDIEPSNGTFSWTIFDGWAASAAAGGWNLSFTLQSRPTWMSGQPANTEGPSSDWNTAAACPTVGGVVLGTTTDCKWKTFMIRFMMHETGLSTVPSAPVSCPQLNAVEAGNEVDTYSGGSSMVGWSASQASFVATSNDAARIIHQWCSVSTTKMLLGSLSAVVGSGGTGNPDPHYDVYEQAILNIVGAANANLYQGVSIHVYPGRDNVYQEPLPTSTKSGNSSLCPGGSTPACYVSSAQQVTRLQTVALGQTSTVGWSQNLPVYTTEDGFNMLNNLGTDGTMATVDNTFGIAYVSEWVPVIAAQGAYDAMMYLDYDSPCTADSWGCYEWMSTGVHSPWYTAFAATVAWEASATAVGACTTSSITGGTMWQCPLTISGTPHAIVWCDVPTGATCTTSTSFVHQEDLAGTITTTGGSLTLSSTSELVY